MSAGDLSNSVSSAVTSGASTSNRRVVNLNVGGRRFSTTLTTLTRDPDSMLARMFSDDWRPSSRSLEHADHEQAHQSTCACKSEHFIDRDGKYFRYILNFLRDGPSAYLPSDNAEFLQELLRESDYFQLLGLSELIKGKLMAPNRLLKKGEVVKWKPEAVDCYWRPLAISLATEGIEFAFLFDKVGRKYNDKQTMAMCFGCAEKFLVDQITVFEYKIRFEEWEALKQHMHFVRGVVTNVIQDTCCVVEWSNHKTLHVPMTAVMPAND